MASELFTPRDKRNISANPIAKFVDPHRDGLPKGSFDQDIDEDVKNNFSGLLCSLAASAPAKDIQLADSPDNLKTRLGRFASAWDKQATVPTTLRRYCSSLVEKVASPNASDLDIWTAVARLLVAPDSARVPSTPKIPESLETLQDMIRDNEMNSISQFYAKTLIFVQSSGMGKSRLADAFGKECPMINFVLREETLGYPPPDSEVLSFMRERLSIQDQEKIMNTPKKEKLSSKRISEEDKKKKIKNSPTPEREDEIFLESMVTTVRNHSIAVGLLQASFEIFNSWVKEQKSEISLKKLAATRHEMMAPYKHNSRNVADGHLRSNHRTEFCHSVVSRAEEIVNSLIQNPDWRHVFYDDRDFEVRVALERSNSLNDLLREAKKLIKNLERFPHNDGEPLLVMVFDEASSLLELDGSGKLDPGRYHALNRILGRLKRFPMWFFFLSTESQVGMLIPANDVERTGNYSSDSSARIATAEAFSLERFPPFLGLQLDVEDRKRMLDPDSRTKELQKKMNEFTQPEHMAMFGRPLWFGYGPVQMNELAKLKLLGGRRGTLYNAEDVHHVFAALSFRLSLDVCLQNPRTLSLARTAVNSFMRVVISMDQETGVLDTVTPSEPVVAKAAMEHLCEKVNWSDSIRTLTEELLDKGLIDKGLKGELYSRFILILAHDWLQKKVSLPQSVPQLQATFTVEQFLTALYDDFHHESVLDIPPEIRGAWMNFNHFVPTDENLTPEVIPELLHDLLRRRAALQLAHGQPTYDKVIPIYFGNPDDPFKESCCGVILVQDKNKDEATTPRSMFGETFTEVNPKHRSQPIPKAANSKGPIRDGPYFVFNEMKNPILFLLFDLGIIRKPKATAAPVQVSHTSGKNPVIWAIHSRGHDRTIFGCLEHMLCGDNSEKFFTSLEAGKDAHYELCQRNKVFSKLARNFRYSGFGEVHERDVKRKWDGDEDIESRDEDGDTQIEDIESRDEDGDTRIEDIESSDEDGDT